METRNVQRLEALLCLTQRSRRLAWAVGLGRDSLYELIGEYGGDRAEMIVAKQGLV